MKFFLKGLALFTFISLTKQDESDQSCDYFNVSPKEDFEQTEYDGQWFVNRLSDYDGVDNQDHITWTYAHIEETSSQALVIESSRNRATDEIQTVTATMNFDVSGLGQYWYDIPNDEEVSENVIVIETDYSNFAIEYSCVDRSKGGSDYFVYIITREPQPDAETITTIENILADHNIDIERTRLIVQD